MLSPELIAELFKAVQENASPSLWSQGVTLTRGTQNTFLALRQSPEECVINLKIQGHAVSPKVTLWPEDLDWDCDCGSQESPCLHVAASVIVLKRGGLTTAGNAASSSDNSVASGSDGLASLHYRFVRSPQGLSFERLLVGKDFKKLFKMPLPSYVAGVKSGRVSGPDVMASRADYNVDQALQAYVGGPLDRKRLEALFRSLESDQKLFLDDQSVQISSARIILHFEVLDEADGYRLRRAPNPQVTEMFPHGIVLCQDTLKLVTPTFLSPEEKAWFPKGGTFWGPEKEKYLSAVVIPALQKKVSLQIHSVKLPQARELPPRLDLLLEKVDEGNGLHSLSVLANIVYGDPPIYQLNYDTMDLQASAGRAAKGLPTILRNQAEERQLFQRLARELQLQPGRRIRFVGQEALDFVRRAQGWEHRGDGYQAFSPEQRRLEARVEVREGENFSFNVTFLAPGTEGSTADFESVFRAWQQGSDDVPLLNGDWAKIPRDWMSRYGKKIREFLAAREARQEIAPQRLPELAALCADLGVEVPDSLRQLRALLDDFRAIGDTDLPADLRAELRSYQRKGVNWLCFLREAKLGALLADDMGLGKTLQMLCALRGRTLIVAPTSVLFNWAQEIQKFRPKLKVNLYYGGKRELNDDADVTLCSYGVLRLDQEKLRARDWDSVVLDEAQTIKNPESQIARAAHSLRGSFRATLSGTPVENRLDDLWSQFQFLNPGLLGSRQEFLDNYARPIERGDVELAARLKARVKPFILRRLKREVAPELPARTEVVLHCELSPEERSTYDAIFASSKQEVLASLEGGGNVLKALEVILRLRQACCHRGLIPGQEAESSSKVDLLMESLEESLAEGHKSLIFSQWTSLLDRIGTELKKRNITHSRIDGSTTNRMELVNEFQASGGPPIMLISLKAGGVGLTLTAADHVYIMDPWWNPAVEDQAADRAHRIGQQNPVMIHRLVARDSIEEKILSLQEKKKDLARAVLDEGGAALSLTRQDIMELLT